MNPDNMSIKEIDRTLEIIRKRAQKAFAKLKQTGNLTNKEWYYIEIVNLLHQKVYKTKKSGEKK